MRHFVPKLVVLKYYNSNVKPTMQNGLSAYAGISFAVLNQLLMVQRKLLRMTYSKRN